MTRSLQQMAQLVLGLADGDLTEWERGFVASIETRVGSELDTTRLSTRQAEILQRIQDRHFA